MLDRSRRIKESVLCAICKRASAGFGFCLPRTYRNGWHYQLTDSDKRLESYRRFCSKRCQDIYYFQITKELNVNKSYLEQEAAKAVLGPLGDYVVTVGMDKGLGQYTKNEIATLVDVVLETYHTKLVELQSEDIPF